MRISENGDGYGKFLFIRHELMISDFHASLEIGCRASEGRVELARWVQGAALWSSVRMPSKQTLPHRPDAFFTLRFPLAPAGQQRSNFFYEADRATTNLTRFRQKLEAYFEYLKQGKQQALGIKKIRGVLVESNSESRREDCMQTALGINFATLHVSELFWFATDAKGKCSMFENLWRRTDGSYIRLQD
jgi:hypothetical protein